jgi:hypothetical protein
MQSIFRVSLEVFLERVLLSGAVGGSDYLGDWYGIPIEREREGKKARNREMKSAAFF